MKTTIELPDALFKEARRYAEAHHVTMKTLVEQGLRRVLAEREQAAPFKLRDGSFDGGSGMSPELKSWEQIRDIIYDPREGRG
jgi:predicted transcriptional regulator